jgi:hypothetical protein
MPAWPLTLPQRPLLDGFSWGTADGLISTAMDNGPPKVRRRYTAATVPLQCVWALSYAQVLIMRAFVLDDLAGAALSFTWPDPLTGDPVTARFDPQRLPSYQPAGPVRWRAAAGVWILP